MMLQLLLSSTKQYSQSPGLEPVSDHSWNTSHLLGSIIVLLFSLYILLCLQMKCLVNTVTFPQQLLLSSHFAGKKTKAQCCHSTSPKHTTNKDELSRVHDHNCNPINSVPTMMLFILGAVILQMAILSSN